MVYSVEKDDLVQVLETAVRMTVQETVAELKKTGFLRPPDKKAYKDTARKLYGYFDALKADTAEIDDDITAVMAMLRDDPYFKLLRLYFSQHKTVEQIAEIMHCDPSTVARNKKRLVLKIHSILMNY